MDNAQSTSSMKALWQWLSESSLRLRDEYAESSSTSLFNTWESSSLTLESAASSVRWMIENKGGFAEAAGLMMVPGPNYEASVAIIEKVCHVNNKLGKMRLESFLLPQKENNIVGIICYPSDWELHDNSQCILYHNPNGITTADYFENGVLSWTPGILFEKEKVPVILYDYLGTGLNKNSQESSFSPSIPFYSTYASIAEDGLKVLKFALGRFQQVDVWGSSLGGGVATVSLDHYLQQNPDDHLRVRLYNHDSFSTTARIAMSSIPLVADLFGNVVGDNFDVTASIQNLIDRMVEITVLCHNKDPIIPEGARMAEYVKNILWHDITLVYSDQQGHANLSPDMIKKIW